MKKSLDERFEQDLLQALRGPLRAEERDSARTRVSRRLSDTLAREVGVASVLPVLLEAPRVAAAQAGAGAAAATKALAGAASGLGGAGATSAGVVGGAAAVSHSFGALLTAFALGAGAGGAALVAFSTGHGFGGGADASSSAAAPVPSAAPRKVEKLRSRAAEPAAAVPSSEAVRAEESALPESSRERSTVSRSQHGLPAVRLNSGAPVAETVSAAASTRVEARVEPLGEQQALLDRARAALASGDSGQAQAALSEHARVYPSSALAEEREALAIKSLITSGDSAGARARAAGFEARYPHSLFSPSIRALLSQSP